MLNIDHSTTGSINFGMIRICGKTIGNLKVTKKISKDKMYKKFIEGNKFLHDIKILKTVSDKYYLIIPYDVKTTEKP